MMKSKPVIHIRLVRNCGVDQGRTMKHVSKVLGFIWMNRRPIGLIVGSLLTTLGYSEYGLILSQGAGDV